MNSKDLLNKALKLYNDLPWWDQIDIDEMDLWTASDEQLKAFIDELENRA